jgi:Enterocin A Immunity.
MTTVNEDQAELLDLMYDFVLNPKVSASERKIGLMAKTDLEKGRYQIAVLNQIVASLQQLAVRDKGLTAETHLFYKKIYDLLIKNKPIGTSLGYMATNRSYLD